jgi:polynucleotide 5'-hydroxyl-kinase GRC3/NOL9
MNRIVEKGKTLLVDGPASVAVTSGRVEVFGFKAGNTSKVVIREGKRLPFAVEETATFDISLAEKAIAEEVDGNTIPPSWAKAFEELMDLQIKSVTAMVLGAADSGKTSFCTYLINRLLCEKKRVAVLDGDLGQSDVGPPCTVAYTFVTKPVTDLFNLQARNAIFIGVTSPNGVHEKVLRSLALLKNEVTLHAPDFIVMNSDGWTEGEEATKYKIQLVEVINPDIIFCIQRKDELTPILNPLEKFRKVVVESPSTIDQRSQERRKTLRELGYMKYLRNSKMQSFPLAWLKIESDEQFGLSKTHISPKEARKIYSLLGMKPLHFVELSDRVSIIIGKRRWINGENLKKVEESMGKKAVVIRKGEEEGLLTALYDAEKRFLGIGVLQEIDYLRKALKMSTPVSENVAVAAIGKVKLDRNMKEIPALEEENSPSPQHSASFSEERT